MFLPSTGSRSRLVCIEGSVPCCLDRGTCVRAARSTQQLSWALHPLDDIELRPRGSYCVLVVPRPFVGATRRCAYNIFCIIDGYTYQEVVFGHDECTAVAVSHLRVATCGRWQGFVGLDFAIRTNREHHDTCTRNGAKSSTLAA